MSREIAVMNAQAAMLEELPRECSVISFCNPEPDGVFPVKFRDEAKIRSRLNIAFHDINEPAPPLVFPTSYQADNCLSFINTDQTGLIVCQCDAGRGRSQATAAAILYLSDRMKLAEEILSRGTYNRPWFRMLVEEAGCSWPDDPLVSVVCRIKYPRDRYELLKSSLRRQRYGNWELVGVVDGESSDDPSIISTSERKGYWGHPYRQLGIDAAKGEYICLANDDNYYTPGFLEQMVWAARHEGADLVICDMLHAYHGWIYTKSFIDLEKQLVSSDLCAWLANAELVKGTPWPGDDFHADARYLAALAEKAKKVHHLERALVVKN